MRQALNDELPNIPQQKTVKSVVAFEGVGVHSGEAISMVIYPADPGDGISFVRTDIQDRDNVVSALWNRVVDTHMCTAIANDAGVKVCTIEHIMAAFYACEIDNARVEISGAEVPIVDGSAAPFVRLIEEVGTQEQKAPRSLIEVLKPISVKIDANRYVSLRPASKFSATAMHEFSGYAELCPQTFTYDGKVSSFKDQIMRARTFGYMQEVEKLWSSGLAKGGSLDNAVVIDGSRVLNKEGFRYPNECVRHKLLDAVGDLYLAGAPIQGKYEGSQCGHALNNQLLHVLFADSSAWRLHTTDAASQYRTGYFFYHSAPSSQQQAVSTVAWALLNRKFTPLCPMETAFQQKIGI